MNKAKAIEKLRIRLDDVSEPFLWTDDELAEYMDEAIVEAVTRAKLIAEEREIKLKAGKRTYDLGDDVFDVDFVVGSDGRLCQTDLETLDMTRPGWRTETGKPGEYVVDESSITFDREPTESASLTARVFLVPVEPLDDSDELPYHMRHHLRTLDWAMRLAYLKRDVETLDEESANLYEQRFIASFGYRHDANAQRKRADHRQHRVTAIDF